MARQSHIQFTIPDPCNVPWDGMAPVDKDQRYCSSCARVITDFSKMSDDELMLFFRHSNGKMCGRFSKRQINRPMKLLPEKTSKAKWWRTLLLIPLTLFGKSAKAQHDSVPYANHPKDTNALSLQNDISENGFGAKLDSKKNDSLSAAAAKNKIPVCLYDPSNKSVLVTSLTWLSLDSLKWTPPIWQEYVVGIPPYQPQPFLQLYPDPELFTVTVVNPDSTAMTKADSAFPKSYPWMDDLIQLKKDSSKEFEKSILSIVLDTIIPMRKKKNKVVVAKNNSQQVEKPKAYKEVSEQPKQKPKPPQPGLPSIDPITTVLFDPKKYPWQS